MGGIKTSKIVSTFKAPKTVTKKPANLVNYTFKGGKYIFKLKGTVSVLARRKKTNV